MNNVSSVKIALRRFLHNNGLILYDYIMAYIRLATARYRYNVGLVALLLEQET